MWKYIVCTLLVAAFAACDDDFDLRNEESRLVMEGWIEDGGYPVVIVTRSLAVSTEEQQLSDLGDYIVRWAKVTVSDGTESVVLTGKYDKGYFPPYIYTTGRLRGEAGKQYTVSVEYGDYYATAKTTIPAVPEYCTFRVEPCEHSDTLYQIKATFRDNPAEKNYYQLFSRVGTTSRQYLASYLGSLDDAVLDVTTEVPVYRGQQLKPDDYIPYYTADDTVSVKLAHIDETSFRVWDSYTKTLSLSSIMFLSTSSDMESNIVGGYGYWCGYGAVTDYIVIRDSVCARPVESCERD